MSLTTEVVLVSAMTFGLIAINIALLMVHAALMRFVFGCVSIAIFALALGYAIPFSPYLQLIGLLVAALGMLAAARVRVD